MDNKTDLNNQIKIFRKKMANTKCIRITPLQDTCVNYSGVVYVEILFHKKS